MASYICALRFGPQIALELLLLLGSDPTSWAGPTSRECEMFRKSLFAGVVAIMAIVPASAFAANELDAFRTLSGSEGGKKISASAIARIL